MWVQIPPHRPNSYLDQFRQKYDFLLKPTKHTNQFLQSVAQLVERVPWEHEDVGAEPTTLTNLYSGVGKLDNPFGSYPEDHRCETGLHYQKIDYSKP